MAHTWNVKPDPKVAHVVTCTTCNVTVWRIFENGKWSNSHEFPGGERKRGLAPRCIGPSEEAEIKISNDRNSDTELTPASHDLFMEFANDAGNWSGTPPTDSNVQMTNSQRGNLTHLKKLGLITTDEYDGSAWVYFTDKGIEYAGQNGVDLTWVKH
jgi:hypothetical protein